MYVIGGICAPWQSFTIYKQKPPSLCGSGFQEVFLSDSLVSWMKTKPRHIMDTHQSVFPIHFRCLPRGSAASLAWLLLLSSPLVLFLELSPAPGLSEAGLGLSEWVTGMLSLQQNPGCTAQLSRWPWHADRHHSNDRVLCVLVTFIHCPGVT